VGSTGVLSREKIEDGIAYQVDVEEETEKDVKGKGKETKK
jgi:hypothetical protein